MLNPNTAYKKLSKEEKEIMNTKIRQFTKNCFSIDHIKNVLEKMNPGVEVDKSKDLMKILPTTLERILKKLNHQGNMT